MTLEKYLIQMRQDRGFSQRELARKSSVSPSEINKIESGLRKKPAPAILKAISDALVLDYDYVMHLAGYMTDEERAKTIYPDGVLSDENGNLRSLMECAQEMYEKDKEWLQTTYLVLRSFPKEKRAYINQIVKNLLGLI